MSGLAPGGMFSSIQDSTHLRKRLLMASTVLLLAGRDRRYWHDPASSVVHPPWPEIARRAETQDVRRKARRLRDSRQRRTSRELAGRARFDGCSPVPPLPGCGPVRIRRHPACSNPYWKMMSSGMKPCCSTENAIEFPSAIWLGAEDSRTRRRGRRNVPGSLSAWPDCAYCPLRGLASGTRQAYREVPSGEATSTP
jgi:hypothetical protein